MKREYLPISALAAWTRLNCVEFHDVEVTQLPAKDGVDKGCGIVATAKKSAGDLDPEAEIEPQVLMTIPSELLLSLELVETCAKTDRHLKVVLDSMRDYAMTARGAILLFLLVHISYSDPDLSSKEHIKVSNAWTEYIKFLPASYSLPTLYTIEERELLRGTSLELALDSKILSLEKEFDQLREATTDISWCDRDWWNEDTGRLTFEDWKLVDAMYRSRALEFPGKGHSMVPCIDMVNHASGGRPSALYETDENGNAVLQLRRGQGLEVGDEITITYGDEKGASEMVFSYGFLDSSSTSARQLFLDLDIPADDPLRPAKIAVCNTTPGFRLFLAPGSDVTDWESSFVWWCCVNEEDGLEFRVVQSNQGERELKVSWKGTNVTSSESLLDQLKADRMWGVFQLRAVVILQDRMQGQLAQLRSNDEYVQRWLEYVDGRVIRQPVWQTALKLRKLEGELLEAGLRDIEAKKLQLLDTEAVRSYLITQNPGADIAEDFS
ncbi:SET domain-containing protein [Histoplasma ohiense]|nr:SET domain-containing protein [Histoplasma ohiense (nom. inval.)]